MHRLVVIGAVVAALVPASALASTTPPDTTPETTPSTEAGSETTMASDGTVADATAVEDSTESPAGEPATIYDDSGNPVASVIAGGAESAWGDYEEGNDPEAGREYLRMTVTVESLITEGTFGINVDDFVLQDNNGYVTTAENVPTAAQAEAGEDITGEADLANGESVELTLTFEVVSSVGPQSIFYRPDDERLVDITDIG